MGSNEEEKCTPCEISVAAGMLINEFCKKDCSYVIDEFTKGDMSLRDLQQKLNIPEEAMEVFKIQGVPLETKYKDAIEKKGA